MVFAGVVLSLLAQDQLENPEYRGWKTFKPGSSVTHTFVAEGAGSTGDQKTMLKSIDENEAVLEVEFIMNGKPTGKAMERKVQAKMPATQAPQNVKEGEEEIDVAGKKMKCKTMEFDKKLSNGKMGRIKFWINAEIPGGAAKFETAPEAGRKIAITASAWEKK